MSKDLLADLDTFYQGPTANPSLAQSGNGFIAGGDAAPSEVKQDDDEWGDFEDANKNEMDLAGPEQTFVGSTHKQATKPAKQKLDDNVIFDADYEDQDNDFGAFEGDMATASGPIPGASKLGALPSQDKVLQRQNLVDLDFDDSSPRQYVSEDPWQAGSQVSSFRISTPAEPDRFRPKADAAGRRKDASTDPSQNETQAHKDWAEFDDWMEEPNSTATDPKPNANAQSKTPREVAHSRSRTQNLGRSADAAVETGAQAALQDEGWDDFEDQAAQSTPTKDPNPVLPGMQVLLPDPSNTSSLPPTNIPPPSLVFTLFAPAIGEAQSSFFQPLSALAPGKKTEALSHGTAQDFVRSYIAIGVVAARTVAGRKLRWKRDVRLSQSMRIGAAGGKGMKLAGVDKSELAKEDREVAELVRVWNVQVGKLRAVVAPTKHLIDKAGGIALGTVPDLKTVMQVVTAKEAEGAVPSQRPCALCGLKREERLAGIEKSDVGDVFGEWWVEGTNMHRSCRNFWEARSGDLRTR